MMASPGVHPGINKQQLQMNMQQSHGLYESSSRLKRRLRAGALIPSNFAALA